MNVGLFRLTHFKVLSSESIFTRTMSETSGVECVLAGSLVVIGQSVNSGITVIGPNNYHGLHTFMFSCKWKKNEPNPPTNTNMVVQLCHCVETACSSSSPRIGLL